jgi:large subunit ribosomal protein L19
VINKNNLKINKIMNTITNINPEKISSVDLIKFVEEKFLKKAAYSTKGEDLIRVGEIIKIGYTIQEGDKERIQYYEGLIIAQQNKGLSRTFTIRRVVQGIGVEQIFLLHSPKIQTIVKKQSSKIRRSKLYFIRQLSGKSTRLKRKF